MQLNKIVLIFLIALCSCSKERLILPRSIKPKYFINCIFKPNEIWNCKAGKSIDFLEYEAIGPTTKYHIYILHNNVIMDSLMLDSNYTFKGHTTPLENIEYHLLAVFNNDTLKSSGKIPTANFNAFFSEIDTLDNIEHYVENDLYRSSTAILKLYINAPNSYYTIDKVGYDRRFYQFNAAIIDSLLWFSGNLISKDNRLMPLGAKQPYPLFTSNLSNEITSKIYYSFGGSFIGKSTSLFANPNASSIYDRHPELFRNDSIMDHYFRITPISQIGYNFRLSYWKQNIAAADLFGEYAPVTSNIIGGLGIFAGENNPEYFKIN